mmetsp:Transcript_14163/g.40282  ORF Transcript_14163/g.40282 Transcript_14163/m.40282 type:complete len:208 (+) Transcript_14163:820-1443(+)
MNGAKPCAKMMLLLDGARLRFRALLRGPHRRRGEQTSDVVPGSVARRRFRAASCGSHRSRGERTSDVLPGPLARRLFRAMVRVSHRSREDRTRHMAPGPWAAQASTANASRLLLASFGTAPVSRASIPSVVARSMPVNVPLRALEALHLGRLRQSLLRAAWAELAGFQGRRLWNCRRSAPLIFSELTSSLPPTRVPWSSRTWSHGGC